MGLEISEIGPGRLSKGLREVPRNLLSNKSKAFELADFQKLWENQKAFCTERLRTSHINKILKKQS
jgi:hypothetical protein